jgi:glyoxylase-like metal-dependent hydrolase (beta-lactamase superfamily II)
LIDVHQALYRAGITVFERGWLSSNNVLIRGDDNHGAEVVDTGYWIHAEQTVALLRHALDGSPLTRILNTHLHSDHCGGNSAVYTAFGCDVDVPVGDASTVDGWDESKLTYAATGQHCPRFARSGVLSPQGEVQAGRWSWQVIGSPGHDPMSVVLYQPDLKLLISADALWENGFGVVFPELEGQDAFAALASTLDALSALDVRVVVPGHGRPFTDLHGAISRARSRLDSFVRDTDKHALHAAKVLVKFRLIEKRSENLVELGQWLRGTRYFELVRQGYFPLMSPDSWLEFLLGEMLARGSLRVSDGYVYDTG